MHEDVASELYLLVQGVEAVEGMTVNLSGGDGINGEGLSVLLGRLLVPAKMALAKYGQEREDELAAMERQKEKQDKQD